MGVMCSKPGGGTSQYRDGLRRYDLCGRRSRERSRERSRSRDLKTWVKSVFSQLPTETNNNNNSVASPGIADKPKAKRSLRSRSTNERPQQVTAVVNLDSDDEDDKSKQKKSTAMPSNICITTENWIDLYAPKKTEDLAVHPKKIQEFEQWLKHCEIMKKKKRPAQLCLLTGPSGCGKTAAVQVLAKDTGYTIQEWTNPIDQEMIYNLGDQVYGESNFTSSQVDTFKAFLFKASRYRSLLEMAGNDKRLLLVEDFPNFLLRDPTALEAILDDYAIYGKAPLVFIVTDTKRRGLNLSYNIFNDQLKQKFLINHISLNPVATTLMQTAMKRFCTLMRQPPYNDLYRPPSTELMDSIILSAQGDIRNALINLHFSSLKGAPQLLTKPVECTQESSQDNSKKTSRKRKHQSTLKSVGRDESVTMMHALGRIFNPKFTESNVLLHSPADIAQAFVTEPKKFVDFIHANYLPHFSDIEHVVDAVNGLSLCDLILNEYREDALALSGLDLAVRNVMLSNKNPVSGWMPVKGPKRLNTDSTIPAKDNKFLPAHHNISKSQYAMEYKTFVNIASAGK
ncbi:cell cycle checkpoint protein RAD17 [Musca vetustissima]|uniref:cell cycle checkpoint protein RAD17 n=1 Tax=Musca vetustissima TaxID=27455 RepID=UPI002AB61084|nr:cell cycle checkpoint protein RAD17 [Musca vetustissima]